MNENELMTLQNALALSAGVALDALVELVVFKDDLRVRDDEDAIKFLKSTYEIIVAELDLNWADYYRLRRETEKDKRSVYSVETWVWQTRAGQIYQSVVEDAVERHRRPARPFSQDTTEGREAAFRLIHALFERGYVFSGSYAVGLYGARFSRGKFAAYELADTLPLTVCRAALAAEWNDYTGRLAEARPCPKQGQEGGKATVHATG